MILAFGNPMCFLVENYMSSFWAPNNRFDLQLYLVA